MQRSSGTTGCLALALAALTACASGTDDLGSLPAEDPHGVAVEAQQDVIVTRAPLGDVVNGTLSKGRSATAVCFVGGATTNAGLDGSAIKVDAGDVSGYAAVTDFPEDPADRQPVFDVGESTLRDRLPSCAD